MRSESRCTQYLTTVVEVRLPRNPSIKAYVYGNPADCSHAIPFKTAFFQHNRTNMGSQSLNNHPFTQPVYLPAAELCHQVGGDLGEGEGGVVGVAVAHVPAPQQVLVHALGVLYQGRGVNQDTIRQGARRSALMKLIQQRIV
jgi:hypothetical protein